MSKAEQFPLVAEGYDILECPHCETQCYPDAQRANGTIIYERHKCKGKHDLNSTMRSFEINADGELVE